jgi:hypothetical protein
MPQTLNPTSDPPQGDADDYIDAAVDAEGCVPCPYDTVFGAIPHRTGPSQELMCSPNVTVGIYSDLNSQDDGARFGSIVNDPANSTDYRSQVLGIRVFMAQGFDFPQVRISSLNPKP